MASVVGVGFPGCLFDSQRRFASHQEARDYTAWLIREYRDEHAADEGTAVGAVKLAGIGESYWLANGGYVEIVKLVGYYPCPCCGIDEMGGDLCAYCDEAACSLDGDEQNCRCVVCDSQDCDTDRACEAGVSS